MPDDLVTQLRSAIQAKADKARAATEGPWTPVGRKGVFCGVMDRDWVAGCDPSDAEHIADNDPAAVLRMCDAHLRIVDEYLAVAKTLDSLLGLSRKRGLTDGQQEYRAQLGEQAVSLRRVFNHLAAGYGLDTGEQG